MPSIMDEQTPAVLVVTFLMERSEPRTRTDQPDQVTYDPNVASPPPPLCADNPKPRPSQSPYRNS